MKDWQEIFSTGVEELDQDHKRLMRVGELIAERVDNPDTEPEKWPFLVREGMKYMRGYYLAHTRREEAYMRDIGYPHYDIHKQVHDEMERTVSGYIDSRIGSDSCELEDILELLGATYGWQMIHIAMDDMAIVGKGAMSNTEQLELNRENVIRELDMMLGDLMHFNAKTRIINENYTGDSLNSAACQKVTYSIDGNDLTLVLGLERSLLQFATETFWGHKVRQDAIDKAHMVLLQWCLTAFLVGFWRNMIACFTHDKSCVLKSVSPLDMRDTRQAVRDIKARRSTLYETTRGRFFVVCDH